ncbi:MAG: short-chain dehydrogenase/reductase [Polaromonas sp.]|nr:short-chain dehydrogenase/reductase [Polaromonas sp.]
MTTSLFIITGASRGMGLAIATRLLRPGHTLLCISRQVNAGLDQQALQKGAVLMQWTEDLANGAAVSARLAQWLKDQPAAAFSEASLINNAGVIPRIAALADMPEESLAGLAQALRVGLEAPLQLTSAFLNATGHWPACRKVLNISSGLGRRAMAAQATYCAAKAGMDHFTRCLALEEARKTHGAKVCSLAPGVIDTDMQQQLRSLESTSFPDQVNFVQLKATGALTSPDAAAARVLAFLASPRFGQDAVADVRG